MEKAVIIRDAVAGDQEELVDTLSDSFTFDPMFNWLFPTTQLYPYFFRMLIRDVYLARGIVHIEEQGRAAALWLPPEQRLRLVPRLRLLRFGLKILHQNGVRPVWRVLRQGALFAKHHPQEPHYYLQFIGCCRSEQGRGIGSALLKQGLRICDERGMPAYLECSNPRNVPLYERHGFIVTGQFAVGKNGPMAWFMWRDPR
jgi:ribosomal protein S18 acetylase RimI-like enzyme